MLSFSDLCCRIISSQEEIEEADDEESYLDLAGLKQQAYMNVS